MAAPMTNDMNARSQVGLLDLPVEVRFPSAKATKTLVGQV